MECLEKLTWNKYTREELERISISSPDEKSKEMVYRNWDQIAKPIDGMGKLPRSEQSCIQIRSIFQRKL